MRVWFLLVILVFMAASVHAATVHGTIYDLDLNPVKNTIVEINTMPNQRMVARDGSYSFSVPKGDYRIKATHDQPDGTLLLATETITVKNEGDYVLDLFLFPDLEEEDEILQDIDTSIGDETLEEKKSGTSWILSAVIIAIFIIVVIIFFKLLPFMKRWPGKEAKDGKEAKEAKAKMTAEKEGQEAAAAKGDLDDVVSILKKHDGRMTQRDLRKEIPLSEAKVSLLVAELEHQGKVKKIKKGRGNILILQ